MMPTIKRHRPDSLFLATLICGCMPSATNLHRLLSLTGSAEALWYRWSSEFLLDHLPGRSAKILIDKGFDWKTDAQLDVIQIRLEQLGVSVLTWQDFPEALKNSPDPPACLFLLGNRDLLKGRLLGVVGTRRATEYSQHVLPKLIQQLAPYMPTIVSGLATGVDFLAHQAALKTGFKTIAVFGTGIDMIYPVAHRPLVDAILAAEGACLSEYPPGFPGNKYTFPNRNRIIAGLAEGVLVSECSVKSGAMITARLALEAGREVMALPGSILNPMSEGPNALIAQGAAVARHAQDVAQTLGWSDTMKTIQPSLLAHPRQSGVSGPTDPHLARVWSFLRDQPVSMSLLQAQLSCSGEQLATWLMILELEGLVRQLPGQHVMRVN